MGLDAGEVGCLVIVGVVVFFGAREAGIIPKDKTLTDIPAMAEDATGKKFESDYGLKVAGRHYSLKENAFKPQELKVELETPGAFGVYAEASLKSLPPVRVFFGEEKCGVHLEGRPDLLCGEARAEDIRSQFGGDYVEVEGDGASKHFCFSKSVVHGSGRPQWFGLEAGVVQCVSICLTRGSFFRAGEKKFPVEPAPVDLAWPGITSASKKEAVAEALFKYAGVERKRGNDTLLNYSQLGVEFAFNARGEMFAVTLTRPRPSLAVIFGKEKAGVRLNDGRELICGQSGSSDAEQALGSHEVEAVDDDSHRETWIFPGKLLGMLAPNRLTPGLIMMRNGEVRSMTVYARPGAWGSHYLSAMPMKFEWPNLTVESNKASVASLLGSTFNVEERARDDGYAWLLVPNAGVKFLFTPEGAMFVVGLTPPKNP